ncbi:hypothetical protein V2W45_1466419 [Cenococcum geophilum]
MLFYILARCYSITFLTLTNYIPNPNIQPSLFVLIELFRVKRARKFINKRSIGEIHLHLNLSSIFYSRPVLLINSDLPKQSLRGKIVIANKYYKTIRLSLNKITNSIYTYLLFPFADIFYFFYTNLSFFRQIARHITTYTYLRVVIITKKIPLGAEREETIKDLSKLISAINIVALFPNGIISVDTYYRRLKELRKSREDRQTLFSITYFAAFLKYAYRHFLETINKPFDFIRALRIYNPVASNLVEHLLNFLKYIKLTNKLTDFFLDSYPPKAHTFKLKTIFNIIYKDVFY